MKVAVIVGHSREKQGAINEYSMTSEFEYNSTIAKLVKELYSDTVIVYRNNGYSKLPNEVNKLNVDLVISLHCNAFNTVASGTETLSSGSRNSMNFAKIIHEKILNVFELPDRGIKIKNRNDRGGLILHATTAPCVLLEPYFIDNDDDFERAMAVIYKYAQAIAKSIEQYKNESL